MKGVELLDLIGRTRTSPHLFEDTNVRPLELRRSLSFLAQLGHRLASGLRYSCWRDG
jgi:hypothetical protein